MNPSALVTCTLATANMESEGVRYCVRLATAMQWRPGVGHSIVFFPVEGSSPLTTTDPNMTRFLMPLEESVALVLYALSHGH